MLLTPFHNPLIDNGNSMPTINITQRTVDATIREARAKGAAYCVWDSGLPGFGFRASPKGHVSWLFQYWAGGRWNAGGRAKRVTFKATDLDAARLHAKDMSLRASKGEALETQREERTRKYQERAVAQAQERALAKVGDTIARFVELKREPGRYWSELEATLKRELTTYLDRTVLSIAKSEVQDLLDSKRTKHPGAARTLYAALSPFFKWCVSRDIIPKSPLDGIDAPTLPEERDRILSSAELKQFWSATGELPLFGPFFRLLLLTAQRRNEVAGMQWSELDLERATWTIPKERSKNGLAHIVHLSPQAMTIIQAKPQFIGEGISGYSRAKEILDKRMPSDIPAWRIHDLRRSAASGMAEIGLAPHVIDRVLNHVQGKLKRIYQRFDYMEERKRALCAWGAHVQALVTEAPKADNVVPMRA